MTDGQYADIAAVTHRYARTLRSGHPMRCVASRAEAEGRRALRARPGNEMKVIYDTEAAAAAAAGEIAAILGQPPQRPYRCDRSKRGHYHLTDPNSAMQTRLRMTVDQNRDVVVGVLTAAGMTGMTYQDLLRAIFRLGVARDLAEAQMFIGSMAADGLITRTGGNDGKVFAASIVPPPAADAGAVRSVRAVTVKPTGPGDSAPL